MIPRSIFILKNERALENLILPILMPINKMQAEIKAFFKIDRKAFNINSNMRWKNPSLV
jgi:hypothetical protein